MKNKIIISLILFILITSESQAQDRFKDTSRKPESYRQKSKEEIARERERERLDDKEYRKRMEKEEKDRKRLYEETAKEEEIRRIKEGEKESLRLELEQLRKERDDAIRAREEEERELKRRKQEIEEEEKRELEYKKEEERWIKQQETEVREREEQREEILRGKQREIEEEIFEAQKKSRNQRREAETKRQFNQIRINQDPKIADVYTGMMFANPLKLSISDFFANHGEWPERNSDIGFPDEYYIGFVQISVLPENAIEIKFQTEELMDKTVELHARVDNGVFIWECTGGTLEKEHRPKECVN